MGFETGIAGNEFQLHEKLYDFVIRSGWTLHSQIDTFDNVYYSSGSDGYQDIFVRTRGNITEKSTVNIGGIQRDFGDGYTGYMNMFAYQYFPEAGMHTMGTERWEK